ncbi:MAG: hypothetical protein Q8N22_03095 [bacterium]|nr:hypothetical protein [bacterium]
MARGCPECGSEKIVNENTGKDLKIKLFGEIFYICKDCDCEWTHCYAVGFKVTRHGKFFKKKNKIQIQVRKRGLIVS